MPGQSRVLFPFLKMMLIFEDMDLPSRIPATELFMLQNDQIISGFILSPAHSGNR
jgi:hypothetical protein